jgi:hypothetical protein
MSIAETIERLEVFVSRFERRYECPSEVALAAVRAGQMKETAEVARWLSAYRDLLRLREVHASGTEPGSLTKTT